ncbi:MAG: dephospho-CoA kinase [Kiritimatiellae bacterium]|nr:dephospho-CoA kinase [Kiritimatiellia bacterium]MDW8458358.1 dephospho-CoA kinase [Verrucomicrobiota bacterium]
MSAPVIAVTGGVGCGKSETGRILAEMGVSVIDADSVAHRLMRDDPLVRAKLISLFGPAVVLADGSIDRCAIAGRVFANARDREALEHAIHPRVREEIVAWRDSVRRESGGGAALIPLLFEVGFDEGWDEIWCVVARDSIADARLAARGWAPERIQAVRKAQWPIDRKAACANVVLENNGTLEDLKALVEQHWRRLERRSIEYAGRTKTI